MEKNRKYLNNAIAKKSTIELVKYLSIEIWNRLGFIYNQNKFLLQKAKYNEVTITQSLIYEILRINNDENLNLIKIYESTDEKNNGADILIAKEFSKGYLEFPFQAKLLTTYKSGNNGAYKYFKHSNSNGQNQQIDLLLESAKSIFKSHLAFYLFYNFLDKSPKLKLTEKKDSYYGLSYSSADDIKTNLKIENFKFTKLHPSYSKAFYNFFIKSDDNGGNNLNPTPRTDDDNLSSYSDVITFFKRHGMDINEKFIVQNLNFKTAEEINSSVEFWSNVENQLSNSQKKVTSENKDYFKPKYRIVLVGQSEKNDETKTSNKIITDLGGSGKELPLAENGFLEIKLKKEDDEHLITMEDFF
jgi:hypothetical protein